ncbi:hypothetical protein CAPTEDRAFT_219050 [Capitella teleta]|uniref:Nuclear pore complex protein Nup88 n=1 Tax=Capitella teleta TaxID=283909 RepID=R7TDB5_CAPTE|nr:hypothetical protein CAPTEDRAFT_219050 [Capitella teleta]|eukprot:ELT91714.1 hypothetical protein CAPTEDRAFT_219050 [Capitella teleta]
MRVLGREIQTGQVAPRGIEPTTLCTLGTTPSQPPKLTCSRPPSFTVNEVLLNSSESHVAIIGKNGASVFELPIQRGSHFEDGRELVICKTVSIAERFFVSSGEKLLHASWHPASETDSHLVLLTSDNVVRVYDICDPQVAVQSYSISNGSPSSFASPPRLSMLSALGDTAVAFDFGSPLPLLTKFKSKKEALSIWPLYILLGNGEIYVLYTSLQSNTAFHKEVIGPLAMYPPVEDNYGTDACSILFLKGSQLPTLVVSTCSGQIHHCVVLSQSEESSTSEADFSEGSEKSIAYEPPAIPSLYVFETVSLELSLTTVSLETDEQVLDDFSCPIRLMAGNDAEIPNIGDGQHAVVEHLICTKPLPSSPTQPILGLCIADERSQLPTLICLLHKMDCITLPLHKGSARPPPPTMISEQKSQTTLSPMKQIQKESFDAHLRKILQRQASNPLLQTSSSCDLSPQDCFRLLSRATQVYREEYIQRLDHAREEIIRRVQMLQDQKSQQLTELSHQKTAHQNLTEGAAMLTCKYEECEERQQQIVHRIETILQKMQQRLPVLSKAEKNMHKELKGMQESMQTLQRNIKQLKGKEDYQAKQIARIQPKQTPSGTFSKRQTEKLRGLLKDENEEISHLIRQVNLMKEDLLT